MRWVSITSATRHTPYRALILGGLIGLGLAFLIDGLGSSSSVVVALLTMSMFGAVISYALVMISYIQLAFTRKDLTRPYKSSLGVGTLLAVLSLAATMAIESSRLSVIGTAIFLLVMIAYHMFYSRNKLVAQTPEEETALLDVAQAELNG